jgi:hypothetical protein
MFNDLTSRRTRAADIRRHMAWIWGEALASWPADTTFHTDRADYFTIGAAITTRARPGRGDIFTGVRDLLLSLLLTGT